MIYEIRDPRWTRDGAIACFLVGLHDAPIPFATHADADGKLAREVWETLKDRPDVAPYVPDPDADRARRAADAKEECRRRIYDVASAEAQSNLNGAINLITATPEAERTDDDRELLATFGVAMQWIFEMRATAAALVEEPAADIHADASWPDCPPAALTMIERF